MTTLEYSKHVPTEQERIALVVETHHKTRVDKALIALFDKTPHEAWISASADGSAVPVWLEKARESLTR